MLKKKKSQDGTMLITFSLPADGTIESAYVVGDFNEWNEHASLMGHEDDRFSITLKLPRDSEYQFRYLVNGTQWQNDRNADRLVPNPQGGENSVVTT
jgi:1,4-alpha-glucan branching enzyme